jgi:hypothetical protein
MWESLVRSWNRHGMKSYQASEFMYVTSLTNTNMLKIAVYVWITPEETKFFPGGGLVHYPDWDLYQGQ